MPSMSAASAATRPCRTGSTCGSSPTISGRAPRSMRCRSRRSWSPIISAAGAPAQRRAGAGVVAAGGIAAPVLRPPGEVLLGRPITPLTRRRIDNFRANRRGFWSLWIFLVLFGLTLFAEFLANDRPLLVSYAGSLYMPVLHDYPETTFGGDFPSETDYRDPAVIKLITENGWVVLPLIPFSYRTITDAPGPFPARPSPTDWLGTADQRRHVPPRLI